MKFIFLTFFLGLLSYRIVILQLFQVYIDSVNKIGFSRGGKMYFYNYLTATLISNFINIENII